MHESLFAEHDGLAIHWAKKHRHTGADFDDLVQDARVGLLLAALKFDGSRRIRFSTYASYWIRNAIQRGTVNLLGSLSAGEEARTQSRWIRRGLGDAGADTSTELLHEIGGRLGLSPDAVTALLRVGDVAVSIDSAFSEPVQRALASVECTSSDLVNQQLERDNVHHAIASMQSDEAAIIRYRFGFFGSVASREAIQRATGIGPRRQRELERSALARLEAVLSATDSERSDVH